VVVRTLTTGYSLSSRRLEDEFTLVFNATTYYDLVSGRRQGMRATAARAALAAAEPLYAAAVRLRNRRYDRGHAITRVAAPVISVGNLTLGGTGKTPVVKWIARWLRDRGLRVALVSRGYGAEQGSRNDEALELEHALPDVPHLQSPDRVAAAQIAIEELASQVILLDDGFQHRRLARALDIVLLDAWEPFGFGHVFPRGTLREPVDSLRRAHVVCLTRADHVDAARRSEIRDCLRRFAPTAVWCEAEHAPQNLLTASGGVEGVQRLNGERIAAFCGIGNPAAFRATLERIGCDILAWREFPDHYRYTAADDADLSAWVGRTGAAAVVCTHKDLVKLRVDRLGDRPLKALVVELAVSAGQVGLEEALSRTIANVQANDLRTLD
jgi:tetraacyldisaccharide 4'-kinase